MPPRETRRARRGWSGPPRLLIVATLLGLVVAPILSARNQADGKDLHPVARHSHRLPLPVPGTGSVPLIGSTGPHRVAPPTVGVASFNERYPLGPTALMYDARHLTERKDVDVVGWQEANTSHAAFAALRKDGWATKQFHNHGSQLAVSWRTSRFAFVSAIEPQVVKGRLVDSSAMLGHAFLLRVTLRERTTGRLLTVIDTHLPAHIEEPDDPGHFIPGTGSDLAKALLQKLKSMWRNAPGRWVIGTGDYNFDAKSDARVLPSGGVDRSYRGLVRSSYSILGGHGLQPTFPGSQRYIDYVHVRDTDLSTGEVKLLAQHTMSGLRSDHRPLIVRMSLR